ncbi:MAG: hypothetical protein ACW97Z_08760 [Candidatus Hodarchaeales archaeon]
MPVCKKCRNYIMGFPCPHCGSDLSLTDRTNTDIQPIIPKELQGDFEEPPAPSYVEGIPERQNMEPVSSVKEKTSPKSRSTGGHSSGPSYSPQMSSPSISADNVSDSFLPKMDNRLSLMENTMKSIQDELSTLLKSQKVIENILTRINGELLRLRKD